MSIWSSIFFTSLSSLSIRGVFSWPGCVRSRSIWSLNCASPRSLTRMYHCTYWLLGTSFSLSLSAIQICLSVSKASYKPHAPMSFSESYVWKSLTESCLALLTTFSSFLWDFTVRTSCFHQNKRGSISCEEWHSNVSDRVSYLVGFRGPLRQRHWRLTLSTFSVAGGSFLISCCRHCGGWVSKEGPARKKCGKNWYCFCGPQKPQKIRVKQPSREKTLAYYFPVCTVQYSTYSTVQYCTAYSI